MLTGVHYYYYCVFVVVCAFIPYLPYLTDGTLPPIPPGATTGPIVSTLPRFCVLLCIDVPSVPLLCGIVVTLWRWLVEGVF